MREKINFEDNVRVRHFDKDGNLLGEWTSHNQTQDAVLDEVIDALDSGTCNDIITMAIGTGSGQSTSDTALGSISSYETGAAVSASQAGDGESVEFSTTFTAGGSWSIEEAGLFTSADGASGMMFYDDSISTSMSASDTLQIDWTISVS
jgi:hypothetical protein